MTRQISAAEIQILNQFEQNEEHKGLVNSPEVAEAFIKVIGDNPITLQSLVQAAQALITAGWKVYMSPAEHAYNQAYSALSEGKRQIFMAFWNLSSTKRALIQDGDQGFRNASAILTGMGGHPFTVDSLNYVMVRVGNSGHLHYAPPESTCQPGQYSGRKIPDQPTNRSHAEVLRDNALPESLNRERVKNVTDWRARAEAAGSAANTGFGRETLRGILVMQPGTTEVDWQATTAARERMARVKESGGF
jgi:hypothetical protein